MSHVGPYPLEISCPDARSVIGSDPAAILLDCRTPEESQIAAIDGSRLIPMNELPDRLGELPPTGETRIIVHCHHGMRSMRVAAFLRNQGYVGAQSMSGGIDEWSQVVDPEIVRYQGQPTRS